MNETNRMTMSNHQLRYELKKIDQYPEVEMTSYEAGFIEDVVFNSDYPMTEKQKAFCEKLIEKYER